MAKIEVGKAQPIEGGVAYPVVLAGLVFRVLLVVKQAGTSSAPWRKPRRWRHATVIDNVGVVRWSGAVQGGVSPIGVLSMARLVVRCVGCGRDVVAWDIVDTFGRCGNCVTSGAIMMHACETRQAEVVS